MNTYLDLADSLVKHAEQQPGSYVSEALMRQAAAVICVQVARVAALEQKIEKQSVQLAELRLQLDYHEREAGAIR